MAVLYVQRCVEILGRRPVEWWRVSADGLPADFPVFRRARKAVRKATHALAAFGVTVERVEMCKGTERITVAECW